MSFVIIHLTDLHMKGKRENNPIFAKKKKLYCVLNSIVNQNDTVLLMVTGDLAFSGNTMEYLECTSFLSEIETHISKILSATVHIALVPGNHDCNFVGDQQVRDILLSSMLMCRKETQKNLIDSPTISVKKCLQMERTELYLSS